MNRVLPVILSGGIGSRLWPVSRAAHPKPFMRLPDGESLLEKTLKRLAAIPHTGEVITVTNRELIFATREEYQAVPGEHKHLFLLEPQGRNTAAAAALAALCAKERHGGDVLLLIMPADHLIGRLDRFASAIAEGAEIASKGRLVTFGIRPSAPETGFGYIELGAGAGTANGYLVASFREKPSADRAEQYVKSGRHLWNSGMFCFSAGQFLRELEIHAPDVHRAAVACWNARMERKQEIEFPENLFSSIPATSIDYAVLEKSRNVAVVVSDFDWTDVGSWKTFSELAPADPAGNRSSGEAMLLDSENCYVLSQSRMVATAGVRDLVIVDTPDAVLVAHKDRTQDVRRVAEQLKASDHPTYRLHNTVHRPWGTYTVLEQGSGYKIKRIVVKAGQSLSLQMHRRRSEHWVVVSGVAEVVNGDRKFQIGSNESTFIPAGHKHRLSNPGNDDLVIIEAQIGDYLEEDDIVRFEDTYGRT